MGAVTKAETAVRPRQQARGSKSDARLGAAEGSAKVVRQSATAVSEAQVIAAVESLYADDLKPVGRILRKRIAELRPAEASKTQDPSIEQLRNLCSANALFSIELEEGGDFFAFLAGREHNFVDIYDPCDVYTSELWSELRAYCDSPLGQDMSLPGGRYACAQALISYDLPCLAGYSLGHICHIVQLAITQKKVLGYLNGAVVAYSKSQSKLKEQLASKGNPVEAADSGVEMLPVASLDVARTCVRQILSDASGQVPLSNVKRYFRSTCQCELSETSLGCSKLSELLRGPHFQDICTVELRESGYVVVAAAEAFDSMCAVDSVPSSSGLSTVDVSCSGSERLASNVSSVEGNDSELSDTEQAEHESFCPDEPLIFEDAGIIMDDESTDEAAARASAWKPLTPGTIAKEGFVVHNTFFDVAPALPTPFTTGAARRAKSVPKELGRGGASLEDDAAAIDFTAVNIDPSDAAQKTPVMISPSLRSPAVYWPPSPAWDDYSQNSFVWSTPWTQELSREPPASAYGLNDFPHLPPPLASLGNVLYIVQNI